MKPEVYKDSLDNWRFWFPGEMESVRDYYFHSVQHIEYDEALAQSGLKGIIDKFPDCHIDAYNHLSISFRNQGKTETALYYAVSGYLIGLDSFPDSFNHYEDKLIWLIPENRPFLKSLYILGLEYIRRQDIVRAENLFLKLMEYNPKDDQQIRFILTEIYYYSNKVQKLEKLTEQFPAEDLLSEVLNSKVRLLNI